MSLKITYLIQFIAVGLTASVVSLMPFIAGDLGFSLSEAGFVKALFNIYKVLLVFLVIFLANKFSNRLLIFISLFVIALGYALIGLSNSYLVLIIVITFISLGSSFYAPIIKAELAKKASPEKRGSVMGNLSTLSELGKFTIISLSGFTILAIGWRYTTLIFGIVALIIFAYIALITIRKKSQEIDIEPKKVSYKSLLKHPKMLLALTCSGLDEIASGAVILFLPFLIQAKQFDIIYLPIASTVMLLGAILGKHVFGQLTDKRPAGIVFVFCEILMAILTLIIAFSNSIVLILIMSFFLGMVTKGTSPVGLIMITNAASKHKDYKSTFSLDILFSNTAAIIAPLLFGFIGDNFGLTAVFIGFSIAALISVIPGLAYHLVKDTKD